MYAMSERYSGAHVNDSGTSIGRITDWVVYNEVNSPMWWASTACNTQHYDPVYYYGGILNSAYTAVHHLKGNVRVLAGALTSYDHKGNERDPGLRISTDYADWQANTANNDVNHAWISPTDFVQAMYSYGEQFDAIALHPYSATIYGDPLAQPPAGAISLGNIATLLAQLRTLYPHGQNRQWHVALTEYMLQSYYAPESAGWDHISAVPCPNYFCTQTTEVNLNSFLQDAYGSSGSDQPYIDYLVWTMWKNTYPYVGGIVRADDSDKNENIATGSVRATFTTIAPGMARPAAQEPRGPVALRVDDLKTPLGIDDTTPRLSWQLQDPARGAKQTAYETQVASRAELLQTGKADVWDSGRIESGQSLNVRYTGPALQPSTRYFWRVKLWDAAGNPYEESPISWWETGLLQQGNWRAGWIGYETAEEATVRHAAAAWITSPDAKTRAAEKQKEERFAYRVTVTLAKPVRQAALYATGQDAVSAWVNGAQVLEADPLPAWGQMPWKKFVRAEVTDKLSAGSNAIAIETVHYVANPNGMAGEDAPPAIATLVVEYTDGNWASFASGADWKSAIHAGAGWQQKGFDDSEWKTAAVWVKAPMAEPMGDPRIPDSVKALRHTFQVSRAVKSARLYATALGAYEMFLNGKRVGDDVLAPGWTDYRERLKYQTYDVTAQVKSGRNALAALLAPGWYETPLEWFQQPNNYGDTPPALRAQLRIEHTDGSVEWIATDTNWLASTSYIQHAEIYDGESQDARLKQAGWNAAVFNASGWKSAQAIDPKPVKVEAQDYPSIRVERTLEANSVTEPRPGVYVYDFGQNFAGVPRLRVAGPAGTDVRLRFAEIVNDDGTIYTDNLRTAKATDHFILDGKGVDEFTPQFTFHGFRYVELTGLPSAPGKEAVTGLVIHTDAPFTAKLTTGSGMINQLWSSILWGQRSNFMSVPTDCPQRDERLGWMADAQVFWRAASYNMDLAAFSRKFAGDMRGTQAGTPYFGIYAPGTAQPASGSGAGWSDAGVIIPWTSWLQTGDTSVIEQNWAAMQKYLSAIETANPDGLRKREAGIRFGDWLSPEGKTDYVLIATAYWAYDATLMRQMAHATGRAQDEEKYARLFEKIRTAFEKQFVRDDGFVAGADDGLSPFGGIDNPKAKNNGGDTQAGYVLALHMNLLSENLRAKAAQKLVDKIEANHGLLGTGFLGTPYLLEELTKTGYAKEAYKLLLNTQYPSWGYLVEHGATTMWERWNGDQMKDDPSMNSYNHYAYGAVADWIYRYAAGVDATTLNAGFHTVLLHPVFDSRVGHIAFDYDSAYGTIHSDWIVKGTTVEWRVTVPANTTGWLSLSADEAAKYKLAGAPLKESKLAKLVTHGQQTGFELAAGSYAFTVDLE
jgi:alpha-L-rhamnosidase